MALGTTTTARHTRTPSAALVGTAYHEAGHAVACFALRRAVQAISIERHGSVLGIVVPVTYPRFNLRRRVLSLAERARRDREVVICFAGMIAEEMATGRRNLRSMGDDGERIYRLLDCRRSDPAEAIDRGQRLYVRAAGLLGRTRHWQAVQAIAERLLARPTLSGRTARRLYHAAVGSNAMVVRT